MLTVNALRALGANVEDGLKRCLNNEAFYLRMVDKAVTELHTDDLKTALAAGDLDKAFEHCHAMKGVLANLSLTQALKPVSEMTELLRAHTACDYTSYVENLEKQLQLLRDARNN